MEAALLISLLAICVAWIGVRQLQTEAKRPQPKPPCTAEALLAALGATANRLNAASDRLERVATARPKLEPLPGTQLKAVKPKPAAKRRK